MAGLIARMQTTWWRMTDSRGQTTSEYLVIAGVIVAIIIGLAATFQDQLKAAADALMGQVTSGAAGS